VEGTRTTPTKKKVTKSTSYFRILHPAIHSD